MPIAMTAVTQVANNGGMTRAQLKERARFVLDELAEERIVDTTANRYTLDEAATEAYVEYAKETLCFKGTFTLTSTIDLALYDYLDLDPSGRLFAIRHAGFDESDLVIKDVDYLNSAYPGWRYASSATPSVLVPYDELQFLLYPAPSTEAEIDIEGPLAPDLDDFTEDADVPAIHPSRHWLLSEYMGILMCRNLTDLPESQIRKSEAWANWTMGIRKARRQIHGTANVDVVVGRFAESGSVNSVASMINSITNL
jgi:hypothetical protein